MAPRRPSKAAIRRARAHLHDGEAPPAPLPPNLAAITDRYIPRSQSPETWEAIRPLVLDVLARSAPQGTEGTRQRLLALTRYIAWCHERGYALDRAVVLDCELIEAFTDTVDLAKTTAGSYRERLRSIVATVNPTGNGPAVRVSIPHRAVKAPYSPAEVAAILRIARTQPSETTGRQVRACVGLGLGAGLDSVDLRQLRARDLEDGDDRGIRVQVRGQRERTVWVLEEFEELVRSSIVGLPPSQLVVGASDNRKHVASKAYQQAVILADAPHFEQSRMRTTWLARLLNSRVPLPVLMQAAGLTSARTITDLIPLLEPSAANEQQLLREGR